MTVDLTTGAYALAATAGSAVRPLSLPAGAFRSASGVGSDSLADRRGLLEVLLVRPGQGAWQQTVADGGAADEDGQGDGAVQFSLGRMLAVNAPSGPAPTKAQTQDLLVIVDVQEVSVAVLSPGAAQ